jgi:predicted ribosomally synthesized peptide with SipW-like signal peptide
MKKPLVKVAVALLLIALASATAGGTYATWSDSETSGNNTIETCSLDLKVNGQDDPPWGSGVEPAFWIEDGQPGLLYDATVELTNYGEADGTAYLHIKNVQGCEADYLEIYLNEDGRWILTGDPLRSVECNEIELGELASGAVMYLTLQIRATDCCAEPATWDMEFQLIGPCGYGDTETGSNYFECGGEVSCGTAYAYNDQYSTCFLTIPKKVNGTGKTFDQWGWTNGPLAEGDYVFDLWWGAGQCDLSKGVNIGAVEVSYHGGTAVVTFDTSSSGYWMDITHVYAGSTLLPKKNPAQYTVAPGKYGSTHDLTQATGDVHTISGLSGDIYVIAHAVGCTIVING